LPRGDERRVTFILPDPVVVRQGEAIEVEIAL